MRVSSDNKAATRRKILDTAVVLFGEAGFDATTTRDLARAAGIASGTLFNYFPTKKAVVATLVAEAAADALAEAAPSAREADGLDEALFALVAAGLRKLKPLRTFLPALLQTALSPLAVAPPEESTTLRTSHLEAVAFLAAAHGHGDLSPTALQLYWTLYTGVLAFWAADASPRQEDTLALLDDSIHMFAAWLSGSRPPATPPDQKGARHADRRPTDERTAGARGGRTRGGRAGAGRRDA